MRDDSELKAALDRLARATEGLSPDEKVALIDAKIADPSNAPYCSYFEMRKAQVLGIYGRKREAADIMKRCAGEHGNNDEMQYFAGEALLEAGEFALADRYLSRCVEIAESSGDDYYLDSAYLLRAYCAARTGRFALALQYLAHVDDDAAMNWLDADPRVSKWSIEVMIGVRARRQRAPVNEHDIDDDDHTDATEDPALTAAQQEVVGRLSEAQLQRIDEAIMKNLTDNWRKVAMIIALAIRDNDSHVSGVIDLFYGQRIMRLVELGLIESVGNLRRMGYSEVRLPQRRNQDL